MDTKKCHVTSGVVKWEQDRNSILWDVEYSSTWTIRTTMGSGTVNDNTNLSLTTHVGEWTRWVFRFFPMGSGEHVGHVISGDSVREPGKPAKNL